MKRRPDRTFHNLCDSKTGDPRIACCSETSNDRFSDTRILRKILSGEKIFLIISSFPTDLFTVLERKNIRQVNRPFRITEYLSFYRSWTAISQFQSPEIISSLQHKLDDRLTRPALSQFFWRTVCSLETSWILLNTGWAITYGNFREIGSRFQTTIGTVILGHFWNALPFYI